MVSIRLLRAVNQLSRWSDLAETLSGAAKQIREGSWVERGLAVSTILTSVASDLMPGWDCSTLLVDLGFKRQSAMGAVLMSGVSGIRPEVLTLHGTGDRLVLWTLPGDDEPRIATVEEQSALWIRGDDTAQRLAAMVWAISPEIEIGISVGARTAAPGVRSSGFSMRPLPPCGRYVGDPDPRRAAVRLRRMTTQSRTRAVLVIGPSGAGKSTFGRLLAREIADEVRTIKISGAAMAGISFDWIVELVETLRPTALVIDDPDVDSDRQSEEMLAMLEAIRSRVAVVVMTLMDDSPQDDDGDGCDYLPGMRPGRIDEVIRLGPPDSDKRTAILRDYLSVAGGSLAEEELLQLSEVCAGLTGAYLGEVVQRLTEPGASWRDVVATVRRFAPL